MPRNPGVQASCARFVWGSLRKRNVGTGAQPYGACWATHGFSIERRPSTCDFGGRIAQLETDDHLKGRFSHAAHVAGDMK